MSVSDGPAVQLPGVPALSADDPNFRCIGFKGWYDAPVPDAMLVPNGGGPGAVAVDPWTDQEAYYTLSGVMLAADALAARDLRRRLLASVPPSGEVSVEVTGENELAPLQVFVRRYDAPDVVLRGLLLTFTLPLVGADPRKYALVPLSGTMGVFTGSDWFRVYTEPVSGAWFRVYTQPVSGAWHRSYAQAQQQTQFPLSVVLVSPGDRVSDRMTVAVTGPLTAGDWFLVNERTGDQVLAEVSVTASQTVVFDSHDKTATLDGSNVDHLIFGDYPTLQPGVNTYRLVSGTASAGFAAVQALPSFT